MLTYEQLLQQQPPTTVAGDRHRASEFLVAITAYLRSGAGKKLAPAQINYLYKLKAKWQVRAEGADTSWNEHGSKPGRRKKAAGRTDIDRTAYGDGEELDPLLRSLMDKFGGVPAKARTE